MKTITTETALPKFNIFASPVGPQIYLEEPGEPSGAGGDGGGNEAAKAAEAAAAAEKATKDAADAAKAEADRVEAAKKGGMSDADAKLLKENMKKTKELEALQARIKEFEGIDPTKARELLTKQEEAAKAAEEAEKKRLAEAGEFDRLRQMMAAEHEKNMQALKDQLATLEADRGNLSKTVDDLTVGTSFANSNYIRDNLVLAPSKARRIYGDHFESENGRVVAYDKPKGAADRTKLVDASGNAIGFEDALKRLVEADPDKDTVLKSNLKQGVGSKPSDVRRPNLETTELPLKGRARIEAALANKAKK
jgi:hypothetical protein